MFERHYDLVVCGGGVAGIAAAVAGARRGLKTVLLEKTVLTGGLATSGMVNIYLPLCDGNGTQVSFGLTEEMLQRSILYGPGIIPANWRSEKNATEEKRYRLVFAPAAFTLALDEMLEEARVDVWLDTVVTGTELSGDRLSAVTIFNKSGAGRISGSTFIDATGDADLFHCAGEPTHCEANALACWLLEYQEGCRGDLAAHARVRGLGCAWDPATIRPGIDGRSVSESVLAGRRLYRERLKHDYAEAKHSRFTQFPLSFPTVPDFRHTRCLDGRFMLREKMQWTRFDDSVGLAADWRKPGSVWELPYRTLLPKKLKNLLAAGRCTSSCGDAWEVTRVIPVAALTGEVSGVAAALSLAHDTTPADLDYRILAKELKEQCGFSLHFADLGLPPAQKALNI